MDRKSNKTVKRYFGICLAFMLFFSVFMYVLERYEIAVNRQHMLELMANHPQLETDIIVVWEGNQDYRRFHEIPSDVMEENIRIMEEKYGYKLDRIAIGNTLRIFWGTGMLTGILLISLLGYLEWKKGNSRVDTAGKHRELYECLIRFREGDFGEVPEYAEESEEWMKLCETLRELGAYFAGLKQQLAEEENSTKALITDISHQLKTPLASLRMSHELVLGNQLSEEEKREFQRQEEKEIRKLEILLDELVNLSRLEAGMIQIKPVPGSFKKTITAAVSQNYMKARNKNIDIQVEMEGDLDIRHDAKWTEEAIANVLDNAVKYSGEHTTVTVRVMPLINNVLVEIEDEGMGIGAEELSRIYKRFYRGEQARQKVGEGAGVGLSLSRSILECQGGTIMAKRKLDKGTVFKITLPL